jgi:hypothetical protein
MLAFPIAELFQFQLGTALGNTDICAVVSLTARAAFKPHVFSFAFFSH